MAVTALVLCGFAVSSQAQTYTTLWERAAVDGNLPSWFGADTERGMGFGTVDGNDRMYVVSRNAGLNVRIVDAMTGADVGTLPTGTDIISGGLFPLQDAEVTDDGVIFAANMTLDATAAANPFKVYMWTSESSDPVNVVTFNSELIVRLGDKFTVTGSVADETAVIWAASSPATGGTVYPVYKFSMSEGAFSSVPEIITLSAGAIGASAAVGPLPNGDFWHNSNGQAARKYQADGTFIGEIPTTVLASGTNSIRYIGTEGNVEQFVTFQYGAGEERAVLVTITNGDFENATAEKTRALRQNSNGNGAGVVDVKFYENGEYDVFLLSTNNAIASYTTREIVPEPATARLQVIHNAADPGAASVDIYVNGNLLLDDFAFRAATPFIDVPAGVELSIAVAPPTSTSVDDAIATFPVTLAADETYVVFANGVLDPNDFAVNPEALDIGFTLFPVAGAREAAENIDNVEFFVFHGATDAPAVDVLAGDAKLVDGASYGDATGYLSVPPASYVLDVTPAGANETVVASFTADLSGTAGASAVVFASGFLSPEANQNGASFALGVALADGTVLVIEPDAPAPELFTEYFEYPIGSLLVDNGWTAHSGAGTNSLTVVEQTLSYEGYAGSGMGNVVGMTTGEDVHRNTGTYTSGSVYASALVNLSAAPTAGDYFLHFGPEPIGNIFRGRVFARGDGAGNVAFGISKAGNVGTADFTGNNYALNQTILLVLEYQFVEGADDVVNLYVNPVGPELPGTPDATNNVGADLVDLSNIALRQGGGTSAPTLVIGNLRVGSDYAEVVGDPAAPVIPSNFVASLSGLNEVPANLSTGMGDISLVLADDELVVTGTFSGLGSDYTMSHIHTGVAGTNGGVVVALTPVLDGDNRGGTYEAAANTFTLTQEQIDAMAAGQYYVNVHSVDLPAGELRGQIYADPNTAPTQVAITAPEDGASVTIEGNPFTPFVATWEAATDAEGHPVNYVWQLAADDQFETIVVNANVGSSTSFTTDFQTVDAILAGAGVPDGGSITVYHRAVATDGSLLTAGTGASVTLTRGELDDPITIAEARGLAIGTPVFVEGIITTPDFGFNSAEFYVQDETAGIKVRWFGFGGGNTDTPFAEGQQVRLAGEIGERFAELLIGPSGYEIVSSGNELPVPVDITRADWTIDSPLQGSRVKVSGLSLVDPNQWPTSAITSGSGVTVQARDADDNIYDIRIDRDESFFEASPLPPSVFNLSGALGRFNDNAQLFPFFADELEGVYEALSGVYHIPQGENQQGFSTLAQAFDAVTQAGLVGPTTLLIEEDLDETAYVLELNRDDLTEQNNLLIKPAPGKTPTITVSANNSGENAGAGLVILSTSWVTIDGSNSEDGDSRDLTITSADNGLSGNGLISVYAGSKNVTIKNTVITYTGTATATTGIRTRRNNADNAGIENFLGMNNQIGTMEVPFGDGFRFWGSETNPNGSTAIGNDIYSNHRGITTFWNLDNEFSGNRIWIVNPRVNQGFYTGIYLVLTSGTTNITGNEIYTLAVNRTETRAYAAGIAINATLGQHNIFNNTFAAPDFQNTGAATGNAVYGIVLNNAAGSAENNIFHNTMRIGSSNETGVHAAFGVEVATSSPQTWNFRNNIMVVEQDAENAFAFHWPMTSAMPNTDFNNLYVTGENANTGFLNGTAYKTLADWQGATDREAHSVSAAVEFVSGSDLRLTGSSIGNNRLAGTALTAVTTDIDGKTRSTTAPYMGAFEGDVALVPPLEAIGPFALVFPTDGFSLTLEGDAATEVAIQWEMPESGEAWARMGGTFENDGFAHGGNGTNAQGKYLGMNLGQEAWIRTPKVMNPGVFKFWAATYSAATVLNLAVEISEDGMTWEELASFNAATGDAGAITSTWQQKEVEVNRAGAFYLRWRQHGENIAGAAYIDDVELSIMGTSNVFEEGFEGWEAFQELKFTWHADLPEGDFSSPLLSIPSDNNGTANTLTLSYGAIDAALESLGIEKGASVNVNWTVTAEFLEEEVRFADSPFALTITRNLDVSTERVEMPLVFSLSQNYPNPFNPTTNIKFTLPETIDVRLEVYNIAGQRVATLVNTQMNAGEHVVAFDGRALASGVYIYRIIAGDFVQSHKMTLIK